MAIYSEIAFGGDAISIKLRYRYAGRISIVKDVVGMPVQGGGGGGLSMDWGARGVAMHRHMRNVQAATKKRDMSCPIRVGDQCRERV